MTGKPAAGSVDQHCNRTLRFPLRAFIKPVPLGESGRVADPDRLLPPAAMPCCWGAPLEQPALPGQRC
jgi:hypothetical protein